MIRLVLARLPQMIVVIIGCTLLAFVLVNVLPGNILFVILGNNYTKQAAAVLSKQLGLDHPLILRYLLWLKAAVHGNLGTSLNTHESVAGMILGDAPPTIELVLGGQIVAVVLAVVLAAASVASRRRWVDRANTILAFIFTSLPSFVLALLVLALLAVHFHLVSPIGWVSPTAAGWGANIGAIALPCVLLGVGIYSGYFRVLRSEMIEQLEGEEYVTLARMKGISNRRVIWHHVIRNSVFGVITVVAFGTAELVAGAVILEQIFAIPGIGQLILTAIQDRDSPLVEGCVTVVAVLIVVLNLLADIAYMALDPRVRETG